MNTKELAAKLDEIAASVAGLAKEHETKIVRLEAIGREVDALLGLDQDHVSRQVLEHQVPAKWRKDARTLASTAFEAWLAEHGLADLRR